MHPSHKTPVWLGKMLNYEYWPIWFFYIPIGVYITYLALKARSATFFTGVNPSIKDSGIIRYSKFSILEMIPEIVKPKGILVKSGEDIKSLPDFVSFPIIAKPDMGERGKGVSILHNMKELKEYSYKIRQDFIIQEFCDLPHEAAIFYVKKPSESGGRITSFTTKEFLHVIGNGRQNIGQLMSTTFRARLQMQRMSPEFLKRIPVNEEYVKIESIGNHNRGTRFINSNHLISDKLVTVFDDISKKIDGFYYGRYDLKFNTIEELEEGKKFKIVELNGINSEPVHIYDQQTGLLTAYRDFFTHIRYMYEISKENKARGIKRTAVFEFWINIFRGKG
ncbi:MAG: ATP-grasp domain-containing protein [Saprospiraceae bacterium]|nr:ATP-grasp domain-containing protein [Saprospiraceae bacterium]